ncbi:MAG: DNA polymerase III subunit delta [Bacteroidales bacterium]|nr:DNA polymerase III subunit delta [Bacteroidales bacterium]
MLFKDIYGHKNTIKNFIDAEKKNRISHAQLFLGQEGIGKISLAIAFAQYLNCENPKENDSCGECKSCKKYAKIAHPDLHFVYPVVKTASISKPVSLDYINKWREFILKSKFHSYNEWLEFIGTDNLQGSIYAQESQEIIRIINLKTFEAKYKVLIIFMPEKMNISAANKLLKAIEEPPPNSLFILISEDESSILTTIRSRTQLIKLNSLSNNEIISALKEEFPETDKSIMEDATKIAAGNYIYARQILSQDNNSEENSFFKNFDYFTELMRSSFSGNFSEMVDLVEKLSKLGREKQKSFIEYSLRYLRENFIFHSVPQNSNLNYLTKKEADFSKNFSKFIHSKNISQLFEEFNKAYFDITRNASPKILFLDLALKISRYLKIKES